MVNVLGHLAIDRITSDWEVNTELQTGDFLLQACDFNLRILELLQQLKVYFLSLIHFFFHFKNIVVDLLQLALVIFLGLHFVMQFSAQGVIFLLKRSIVPFVSDSDTLILRNHIFLLESSFLIVRDDFFMFSLQIGDLFLLFLS